MVGVFITIYINFDELSKPDFKDFISPLGSFTKDVRNCLASVCRDIERLR